MKKPLLLLSLFLSFFNSKGQNLPQCDSLVIQCCTFDSVAPNTLTIYVTNNSSYLFDYPDFVLFNPAMDTVAKETVTYFGIGTWPQPHTLNITTPITLPFNGYLNLYAWFGDSLCCSWPFNIADTVTGISILKDNSYLKIYPNPSNGKFTVSLPDEVHNASLKIWDALGRLVDEHKFNQQSVIINKKFNPGIYLVEIADEQYLLKREKLIIQ